MKELLEYVKQHYNQKKTEEFVRTINDKGETSLHCAAKIKKSNLHFPEEDRAVIKLLMENGSDVFTQTQDVSKSRRSKSSIFKLKKYPIYVFVINEIILFLGERNGISLRCKRRKCGCSEANLERFTFRADSISS